MSYIEYRKGDLFHHNLPGKVMLAHGCNAQGVMGSGVAKAFKELYMHAYLDYQEHLIHQLSRNALGTVAYYQMPYGIDGSMTRLASMITQEFYGKDDKKYVSYDAIHQCFKSAINECLNFKIDYLIFPRIGAGLGGGDWRVIESIIESACDDFLVDPNKLKLICFDL